MNIPDKKIHSQHHFVTPHCTIIFERLRSGRTARRVMKQTLDVHCTVHETFYAIGYPGPVVNHLAVLRAILFQLSDG